MEGESSPSVIGQLLTGLWDVWAEMFSAFMDVLPKAISFVLWLLSAVVILPCVFVAGTIYPAWEKWGEGF